MYWFVSLMCKLCWCVHCTFDQMCFRIHAFTRRRKQLLPKCTTTFKKLYAAIWYLLPV